MPETNPIGSHKRLLLCGQVIFIFARLCQKIAGVFLDHVEFFDLKRLVDISYVSFGIVIGVQLLALYLS